LVGAVPPPVAFTTSTAKLELIICAGEWPVAITIFSVPLKLNFSKSYALVDVPNPVVKVVKLPDVVPLCISPPLATITWPLNIIEQSTVKLLLLDPCGTIVVLYWAVPLTRLYPPFISGSKFCSIRASPGLIENTSLFSVNPPAQLTTKGDIRSVVGILLCSLFC